MFAPAGMVIFLVRGYLSRRSMAPQYFALPCGGAGRFYDIPGWYNRDASGGENVYV
jgi:hypothetical protein